MIRIAATSSCLILLLAAATASAQPLRISLHVAGSTAEYEHVRVLVSAAPNETESEPKLKTVRQMVAAPGVTEIELSAGIVYDISLKSQGFWAAAQSIYISKGGSASILRRRSVLVPSSS